MDHKELALQSIAIYMSQTSDTQVNQTNIVIGIIEKALNRNWDPKTKTFFYPFPKRVNNAECPVCNNYIEYCKNTPSCPDHGKQLEEREARNHESMISEEPMIDPRLEEEAKREQEERDDRYERDEQEERDEHLRNTNFTNP